MAAGANCVNGERRRTGEAETSESERRRRERPHASRPKRGERGKGKAAATPRFLESNVCACARAETEGEKKGGEEKSKESLRGQGRTREVFDRRDLHFQSLLQRHLALALALSPLPPPFLLPSF